MLVIEYEKLAKYKPPWHNDTYAMKTHFIYNRRTKFFLVSTKIKLLMIFYGVKIQSETILWLHGPKTRHTI